MTKIKSIESTARVLRGPIFFQTGEVHRRHWSVCSRREGHVLRHGKTALRGRDIRTCPDVPFPRGPNPGVQIFACRRGETRSPLLQVWPEPAHTQAEGAGRAKILTKVLV